MPTKSDLKQLAKDLRTELKTKYPQYKFSVTVENYNALYVCLMAGPVSPFADGYQGEGYQQLNHYYLEHYAQSYPYENANGFRLTDDALAMLKDVTEIANRENWDESDSQSDYFHCNYYFNLHIGKFDKPYQALELVAA